MSTDLPNQLILDGRHSPPPDVLELRAGPLTAVFQPETGWLRYVRLGDHEIVRAVYGAVRDTDWNTLKPTLSKIESQISPDTFTMTFEASVQCDSIDFHWIGSVAGETNGKITYRFQGEARSAFATNRTGLCLLHPIQECAGNACAIEHPDGNSETSAFPKLISPHQPIKRIRKLSYDPAPNVRVDIDFEGAVFEMEDQRNWSDGSFKTYAPPLDEPFPLDLEPGYKIVQTITVSLPGTPRRILPILLGRDPQFSISTTNLLPLPPLGLQSGRPDGALSDLEIQRLRALPLSHLRVDLPAVSTDAMTRLDGAMQEAAHLNLSLHVAVHMGEGSDDHIKALARHCSGRADRITLWLLFSDDGTPLSEPQFNAARGLLAEVNPQALFACGTDADFVSLNRHRLSASCHALPCYSITPQVHATDHASMIETLAAQPMAIETIQGFAPRSVVISPITLKPRHAIDASRMEGAAPADSPAGQFDPRQMSLFGAGWTLGSLANLATAGHVHSLTFFATTGWNGLMAQGSPPVPLAGVSHLPDCAFPVYHVLADLAGYDKVRPTHSSHPLLVQGLTLMNARNERRLLVANLTAQTLQVRIKTGTCQAKIKYLDETNVRTAMLEPETFRAEPGEDVESQSAKIPLSLKPYALARVDIMA